MSQAVFLEETERKPNRYASNVLGAVVAVIVVVCAMNELGIFQVHKALMRLCLAAALAQYLLMLAIIRRPAWLERPSSKYIIMSMVLLLVLTVAVLLNIHAVLGFVLPLLLATQYRSRRISALALAGACFCCCVSPLLSYLLGTWSLNFLTGYIETFCRVTITAAPAPSDAWVALGRITLYWSLPQVLTLCAFGIILFSVTRSGIDSVRNQIQVLDLSEDLQLQLRSIMDMQEKVLFSMSDIIESRDIETGGHVRRTSEVVRLLLEEMRKDPRSGVTEEFCRNVVKSAPMHDLGKIAVPDAILRKPDKLTEAEFDIVKLHPDKSAEIIDQVLTGIEDEQLLAIAKNIARYHHERVDGRGYPQGLRGEEIPLEARVMAIADVYDSLVSERCYKAPIPCDEAFRTIEAAMGSQFDPGLNPYFQACWPAIRQYYAHFEQT